MAERRSELWERARSSAFASATHFALSMVGFPLSKVNVHDLFLQNIGGTIKGKAGGRGGTGCGCCRGNRRTKSALDRDPPRRGGALPRVAAGDRTGGRGDQAVKRGGRATGYRPRRAGGKSGDV